MLKVCGVRSNVIIPEGRRPGTFVTPIDISDDNMKTEGGTNWYSVSVQWRILVLTVLNLRVVLPEN
jgi:hypothetical protein